MFWLNSHQMIETHFCHGPRSQGVENSTSNWRKSYEGTIYVPLHCSPSAFCPWAIWNRGGCESRILSASGCAIKNPVGCGSANDFLANNLVYASVCLHVCIFQSARIFPSRVLQGTCLSRLLFFSITHSLSSFQTLHTPMLSFGYNTATIGRDYKATSTRCIRNNQNKLQAVSARCICSSINPKTVTSSLGCRQLGSDQSQAGFTGCCKYPNFPSPVRACWAAESGS